LRSFCPRCGAELPVDFRGQWFDTSALCSECGVAPAEVPAPLVLSAEGVSYTLTEMSAADRSTLTAVLVEGDIQYRWEPDLVLVVAAGGRLEVDRVLEDFQGAAPSPEADHATDPEADMDDGESFEGGGAVVDEDADGGEEATEAMGDLFVAADRLLHAPHDEGIGADLADAALVAGDSLPPYGVDSEVWRTVQGLASSIVSDLEHDADDDVVVAGATKLRNFLRNYV